MSVNRKNRQVIAIFVKKLKIGLKTRATAYEIAKRTGLSHSIIYAFKDGKNVPGLDSAEKIANALGYSLGEFISDPNAKEHDVNECFKRVCEEWGRKRR
jgi:transcriptional regulator with XRE-family HTH domain